MSTPTSVIERVYPVIGTTPRELAASIEALGPARGGRRFVAYTDWKIAWRYAAERRGDGVAVGACLVDVHALVTIPRWRPLRSVPDNLRERWARWIGAVRAHEQEHVLNAHRARAAVREAIAALTPATDRDALDDEVHRVAVIAVEAARRADVDYDLETLDGAAQGATLAALIDG